MASVSILFHHILYNHTHIYKAWFSMVDGYISVAAIVNQPYQSRLLTIMLSKAPD